MTNHSARIAICLLITTSAAHAALRITARREPGRVPAGFVEIRGLCAGPFSPAMWKRGALNLVPDVRDPILDPRPGQWRNIYAPTIVTEGKGYRVYYGGWDGSETGNDRIYTTTTPADFASWGPRSLAIDKGPFIHVNNCSAVRTADGAVTMLTTCYPVPDNTNKPGVFTSPDGVAFNGANPYSPAMSDLVSLAGYDSFAKADINGMNVLLRDGNMWRMYFGDFANFGQVFRASSSDARQWMYDGVAVKAAMMVNDLKPFRAGGKTWYLMLLHQNADVISTSVSTDSARFPTPRTLLRCQGGQDRYIVACGLVTDGRSAYGVLYGAGAVKSLDQNRIFARWLQKRVVIKLGNLDIAIGARAFGPDCLRITLPAGVKAVSGRLTVYSEDGVTRLGSLPRLTLHSGDAVVVGFAPSKPSGARQREATM